MTVRKLIQMCNYVIETGRLLLIVKVSKPSANLKNTFFFFTLLLPFCFLIIFSHSLQPLS